MSLTNGNFYFEADTPTYYSAHSGCTYADIFQNVVLPAFKEWDNRCEYVLIGTSPGIKMPWHDGTMGDTVFPVFWISGNATATVSTGNISFYFGLSGNSSALQGSLNCYKRTSTTGGGGGVANWNVSSTKMLFRIYSEDGAYHFGMYPINYEDVTINTPYHVSEIMTSNGDFENCAMSGGNTNSSLTTVLNYYLQIESSPTKLTVCPNAVAIGRSNVGQVVPVDVGNAKHQKWYVYTQQNTSMKGEWDSDTDLLASQNYIDKVWYPNAFTIDGQAFDAFILGTTASSGNYGISLCRKHEEE